MALPSMEQYNEAAQNPQYAFFDPELQQGKIKKSGLGIPLAACGGFALTYTITSGSRKYAVRCFHREATDRKLRYEAITKKLENLHSGYFVNFQFQQNGIRIQGHPYPIVKMAWADGITLGEFLEKHYREKNSLANLKKALLDLAIFLQKNSIAHGDLQPGNIMVANDGNKVQLIDYDGMFLPELARLSSAEVGHVNFQHPERASLNPWNDQNDHFAFILIFIALDALMADPALWARTRSDGDKFLLGANDFIAPAKSAVFRELAALPGMADNIARFADIYKGAYEDIPSLPQFLNASFQIQAVEEDQETEVGYITPYPVLDGKDFTACVPHVGDMVELVGKVVDVAQSYTKFGTPYVFLNFSDWRGDAVKISIWSQQLKKMPDYDFKRLKNRHISVIGLLEPPYESKKHNYRHIGISLSGSINEIDAREMAYRLNYEKGPLPKRKRSGKRKGAASAGNTANSQKKKEATGGNQAKENNSESTCSNSSHWNDFADSIKNRKPAPHTSQKAAFKKSGSSNRDILADILNTARSANGSTVSSSSASSGGTASTSPTQWQNMACPYCGQENYVDPAQMAQCHSCGNCFQPSLYAGSPHAGQNTNQTQIPTRPSKAAQPNPDSSNINWKGIIIFFLMIIGLFTWFHLNP